MDVKDQYMDVTTKIWTLQPRTGRFDQDMDVMPKKWMLKTNIWLKVEAG